MVKFRKEVKRDELRDALQDMLAEEFADTMWRPTNRAALDETTDWVAGGLIAEGTGKLEDFLRDLDFGALAHRAILNALQTLEYID